MKTLKQRLLLTALTLIMMISMLTACAQNSSAGSSQTVDLGAVIENLYKDIDVPPNEIINLDETNLEYFAFVPYSEHLTGAAADALVNITPHSLVVIHTDDGSGAELAKQVSENADPNKWLCVRADSVRVAYTDHYVVLVMSFTDTADAIIENFKSIAMDLDNMEMTLLAAVDYSYE